MGTRLLLTVMAGALFALGVVLTQSRTGLMLLLPALLSGNAEVAADRLAAVLAHGGARETVAPLLATALSTPEGRRAFARRLAGPGYWHPAFLRLAPVVTAPDDFAEVIALAREQGAAPECGRLRAVAATFRRTGNAAAAAILEGGNRAAD